MVMPNQIRREPMPKDSMNINSMGVSSIKGMKSKFITHDVMKKPIGMQDKTGFVRDVTKESRMRGGEREM